MYLRIWKGHSLLLSVPVSRNRGYLLFILFTLSRTQMHVTKFSGFPSVDYISRPNFFLQSSRIRIDLISYESIPTDKREQYDRRAEKNLDGLGENSAV